MEALKKAKMTYIQKEKDLERHNKQVSEGKKSSQHEKKTTKEKSGRNRKLVPVGGQITRSAYSPVPIF